MKSRAAQLGASLAALGCVLVGGCGSDDDTASTSTTAQSSASSVVVTTTIAPDAALPTDAAGPTVDPAINPAAQLVPVGDVDRPIAVAVHSGRVGTQQFGDSQRLFVATQNGKVVAIDGQDQRVVLDITDQTSASGERGLLGLAMSPRANYAYVNFTNSDGDTVVAEFSVNDDGTFDRSSQRTVLTIDQPYANHNGGALAFGPDGMLYIATGDGGAGGDPQRLALRLDTLLGKLLRIDPTVSGSQPYVVPADNPFVGQAGARPEIWSYGLRNPWRFSFDGADLWIADVGQGEIEEVNWARGPLAGRGVNFGWSAFEGSKRFNDDQPTDGAVSPFYEYTHADGGCSISGGVRYRGQAIPALQGWYVFSDYCRSTIRALQIDGDRPGRVVDLAASSQVAAVSEGVDGELYVLSLDTGLATLTP